MSKSVRLYSRDVEVLTLLADRQVETLDFFHQHLWADNNRKSAYNRLKALANAGYLEHVKRDDPAMGKLSTGQRPANEHLFALGPKAPTALRIRGREAISLARRHRRGGIPAALIDHQLATNRVADSLGVHLMSEHEAAEGMAKQYRKHRPDGAYTALADHGGRELVLVEVDLGHYSRARIIEKTRGMLCHEQARTILFVSPTFARSCRIADWVHDHFEYIPFSKFCFLSFEELDKPDGLPLPLRPVVGRANDSDREDPTSWWTDVMGRPGCL